MSEKAPTKAEQLRAMRESREARSHRPNPFEDAVRGRDPAPTSSGEKSEKPTVAGSRGNAKAADRDAVTPVKAEREGSRNAPRPPEAKPKKTRAPNGTFDRKAYQREYMRVWRAKK